MSRAHTLSRRRMLAAGAVTALSPFAGYEAFAAPKKPGEVRVLFQMGDYFHNSITQEKNWRYILRPTGWMLLFAQAARFVTPDVLAQADLLVESRYAKTNSLGWSPDPLADDREDEERFLTDEREQAIFDNVRGRGMGLLALHCAIWNGENKKFMDFLGIAEPHMHTRIQPTLLHKTNQEHPITRGVEQNSLGEDEIFSADLIPGATTPLFNLKGDLKPIDTTGGWCREEGKGRIVVLLPGHNQNPFHSAAFKDIMWRSAHWAMSKDIPAKKFEAGRPPEDAK